MCFKCLDNFFCIHIVINCIINFENLSFTFVWARDEFPMTQLDSEVASWSAERAKFPAIMQNHESCWRVTGSTFECFHGKPMNRFRRFMCFCYSPVGLKSGARPGKVFNRQCFRRWFEFVLTFLRLESSISLRWKSRKASTEIPPWKFVSYIYFWVAKPRLSTPTEPVALFTKRFDNR